MTQLLPRTAPVLRQVAQRVEEFDSDLSALIAEMFCFLDGVEGAVALAAPQIGVSKRVVVYDLHDGKHRGVMVNPIITSHSENARPVTEGCLSFPGQAWRVRRWMRVGTTHFDRFGHVHVKDWHFLGAQMVQHELEHLDGILLPDVAIRRVPAGR